MEKWKYMCSDIVEESIRNAEKMIETENNGICKLTYIIN